TGCWSRATRPRASPPRKPRFTAACGSVTSRRGCAPGTSASRSPRSGTPAPSTPCPARPLRPPTVRAPTRPPTAFPPSAPPLPAPGNPAIAALRLALAKPAPPDPPELTGLAADRPVVLVTAHRRESFGAPLDAVCRALATLAARTDGLSASVVYPVHPNPNVQ